MLLWHAPSRHQCRTEIIGSNTAATLLRYASVIAEERVRPDFTCTSFQCLRPACMLFSLLLHSARLRKGSPSRILRFCCFFTELLRIAHLVVTKTQSVFSHTSQASQLLESPRIGHLRSDTHCAGRPLPLDRLTGLRTTNHQNGSNRAQAGSATTRGCRADRKISAQRLARHVSHRRQRAGRDTRGLPRSTPDLQGIVPEDLPRICPHVFHSHIGRFQRQKPASLARVGEPQKHLWTVIDQLP